MGESFIETSREHGKEMYIIALEHAVSMLEILDRQEALDHLKKNIAERKVELATPEHSRFDEKHRLGCGDCHEAYLEFLQEQEVDGAI